MDSSAKEGKTSFELVDFSFIESMARQMTAGLLKPGRRPNDWQERDPVLGLIAYRDALIRHYTASELRNAVDDTGESHYAAIAVNAMICHWYERRIVAKNRKPRSVKAVLAELQRLWGMSEFEVKDALRRLVLKIGS